MPDVIRWGRTAYETDESLALERQHAERLGLTWAMYDSLTDEPDFEGVGALVIPSKVHITRSVIERFAGSLVLTTTSGYDHIDISAARRTGIRVARCPMARRDPVVEHAVACAMMLMRRTDVLQRAATTGHWARADLPGLAGRAIAGARVLIVGMGMIGQRMAEVLRVLGADVCACDPVGLPAAVTAADLALDLPRTDLLTLHCSLTSTSRNWLNAEKLDQLPAHAVVVNTARGDVMDVAAAVDRVRDGRLRGVACDVFPTEPYPSLKTAASVPGVILSPHAAGYVHDLGLRVADEVGRNLAAWVAGEALPGAIA